MVMVRFGSVGAEKQQKENWKLVAMAGGNFGNVKIRSKSDIATRNWNEGCGKGNRENMVRSTLRSRTITQNVTSRHGDFQNLLTFLVFAMFRVADLNLELNSGSQYYEDSDAEVMVPFGSVGAEK